MISRFSLNNIEIILYYIHIKLSLRFFKCDNCSYSSKDFFCNTLNDIVALVDMLCTNINKPTIEYLIYNNNNNQIGSS